MNMQLRPERTSSVQAGKCRVAKYDWVKISEELSSQGCAVIERLLSPYECRQVAALYSQEEHFRSHVQMARHGFGRGEYRYFKYPLPELLSGLRTALYPHLAVIANDWNARMNIQRRYPAQHVDFLEECHSAGQTRPTPLLLQYVPGDFNCLHQDLYGDLAFRSRLRSFSPNQERISPVASSFCQNNGHVCRAAWRWCHCSKVMQLRSPCITGP
jgi:uncharacterized protein